MLLSRKGLVTQLTQASKLLFGRQDFNFVSASVNFVNSVPIYKVQKAEGEYTIIQNNQSHENQICEVTDKTSVKDLIANIETKLPGAQLSAYSLEEAEIPINETLENLGSSNFYLISKDNKTIYTVVSKAPSCDPYAKLDILLKDLRLAHLEKQIILNYIKRLDIINEMNLKEKVFIDDKDPNVQVDRITFQKNLIEALVYNRNLSTGNESELIAQYTQNRLALNEKLAQREILSQAALKKAKRKMLLGLGCLVGQFVIVGWGTYVSYSWDIMEPISYFMSLSGTMVLSAQFFKNYEGYTNKGFLKYLQEKELLKICKQIGFSLEELESLKETQKALENKLKANILADS